jgi:hypothetical protein
MAFDYKCEAFIKFKGFLKTFSEKVRLFKNIFSGIEAFLKLCEAFQKIRGFFKTFKTKLRLFLGM